MYGETYPTRYQADKVRKTDPYHRGDEKIGFKCTLREAKAFVEKGE